MKSSKIVPLKNFRSCKYNKILILKLIKNLRTLENVEYAQNFAPIHINIKERNFKKFNEC